jgi:hypothetical protein
MDFIIIKNARMDELLETGIDLKLKNYIISLFQPPNSYLCL